MDRWLSKRQRNGAVSCFVSFLFTLLVLLPGLALGMPAYPELVTQTQPDGTIVEIRGRGDEHFNWLEDANGFTVVRNKGWLHYARLGTNGQLEASVYRVGIDNPAAVGLSKKILPSTTVMARSALTSPDVAGPEAVPPNGTVKNLVILVRFSDHVTRTQVSEADLDVLFNAAAPDPDLAPTGSLKALYDENSYGLLNLESTVAVWATVSNTEAYYANGQSGLTTRIHSALREALTAADAYIDFNDFDMDSNGEIDSITFLHSGFGAERTGVDEYGTDVPDRIWSHKWSLAASGVWTSTEGVAVRDYHISPSVWGLSGNEIGHVGVIAHETGHFFGLPDLYAPGGSGDGIGSWGLMANSWGFDGSQLCPPHMSPWSKEQLGWYTSTVIADPGQYTLNQAETNAEAYKITANYPGGEYLMIENRQNAGFDCSIPQGGLVIWHIDNAAGDVNAGFPGQLGWPANGLHYRVAVLQADGDYDLEHGNNRGDSTDPHHAAGIDAITTGPGGHPNTDAYQGGNIIVTGHTISNISASGPSMSFCLGSCSSLSAPSGLVAISASSTSIDLTWADNSTTEDGFTIDHSDDGSTWAFEADVGVDVTAYGDTGLTPGTTHYYRVRAFETSTNSGWSNTANATTDQVAPAAPTGLTATAQSQTQIDLTWADNANNEDNYRVDRSTDGVNFSPLISLPADSIAYSNTGLAASQTYFYQVVAVNAVGSAASDTASATTDAPPPLVDYVAYGDQFGSGEVFGTYADTHTDDGNYQYFTEKVSGGKKQDRTTYMGHFWRFDIVGGDQITVITNAWRSATSDNDNFVFAWSDDNINYHDLFTVDSEADNITYSGTIPNTVSGPVWIRVIDTDRTGGNSRSRDSLFVDHLYIRVVRDGPPTEPNAPDGLVATATGKTSIDLSWADNSINESGFRVERSLDDSSWSQVINVGSNVEAYSDTSLTAGTTYYYRVFAFNGEGDSAPSVSASATTDPDLPPDPPAAPSSLGAIAAGPNSIDLTWADNADNETAYRIQRRTELTSFATIGTIGANSTSYTDTGLIADTEYFYRVFAYNGDGDSGFSNVASESTDPEPPVTLSLSAAGRTAKGKQVIDLSWTGAAGTNVDVYRDGNKIATTANNGAYSDATGLRVKGAVYQHFVCEQDSTTVCSNETVTSF